MIHSYVFVCVVSYGILHFANRTHVCVQSVVVVVDVVEVNIAIEGAFLVHLFAVVEVVMVNLQLRWWW